MLFNEKFATEYAGKLLKIEAIKLSPDKPFTWASGWKSPIYCDNRITLSYPEVRNWIKTTLCNGIRVQFKDADVIAGVATAGIPHGAIIADDLNKPFIYVRSEAKKHGLSNQIEGRLNEGEKVVVVEDLISTGASSLNAVEAIRNAGGNVVGLAALFTYSFQIAQEAFEKAECKYFTIGNYPTLVSYALENELITPETKKILEDWRLNPAEWTGL